jgi:spore photoproduct lyase
MMRQQILDSEKPLKVHNVPNASRAVSDLKVKMEEYEKLDGSTECMVARVGDGSIITRFDRTPVPKEPSDVVCPHFLELKWATGCPYSCAWCYLQGTFRFQKYKKSPMPKSYDRISKSLLAFFEGDGVRPELLNAGELSDSMITEHTEEPFSIFVMDLISKQDLHKILFVTKSNNIDNLLNVPNKEQAIVSFSLNAVEVAEQWEKAPAVKDRIEAAGKLSDAGFEVRVRIDPMVPIEGWKEGYATLLKMIFDRLKPSRITIGSLRGLQSTINNSKDKSWVPYLEERSNWGRKIATEARLEMYKFVIDKLRDDHGYLNVALCKETVDMWERVGLDYTNIRCNCTL